MFPPKAARHSIIVTNVKDSEAPLMRFKRPRLNLSNNNDTGNSVMTESQVKAKLIKNTNLLFQSFICGEKGGR